MRNLMLIMVFTLVACGRAEQSEVVVTAEVSTAEPNKEVFVSPEPPVRLKPGAAILFTSNYAGSLAVGELAAFIIQLQPQYPAGQLNVSFSIPQGLSVEGQTEYSENFVGPQEFIYELMIGSNIVGEYNLGIIVSVVTDSGLEEARAFAEVISVTDPLAVQAITLLNIGEDSGNEEGAEIEEQAEHFMEAQEEIIFGP